MQIIRIPSNKKPLGKGLYGKYFQVSARKGIKILGRGYKSIDMLFTKYHKVEEAELEALILKKAEKSKISPRGAKPVIVRYKGLFHSAIQMQHINGKTLCQIDPHLGLNDYFVTRSGKITRSRQSESLGRFVKRRLMNRGLVNRDLHLNNVIINRQGKVKVIDFSPEWIKTISLW